ncbi:hypothetical protein BKK81_21560 [Cupriavidus sp. USMAHM13]|uniref:hypothetical protein n=1 Tax=Cupriavidus sp. USMAHM13 TaxID=1389192 RepID=UPI0008A6B318|nr:hypothetical protein [Cupriavidus sp. USMAHM13]AOZ01936.1 hypothetical protein BKK81_21560 [Cupriavidus sp. USMAHM13]
MLRTPLPRPRSGAGARAAAALLGLGLAWCGAAQAINPLQREDGAGDAMDGASARSGQGSALSRARDGMAAWEPVAAERLEALRGGFDVGAGLQVSFGIDRAVLINGQLVVSTSLNIPDVSQITAAQANKLASLLGNVSAVVANANNAAAAAGSNGRGGNGANGGNGGSASVPGTSGAAAAAALVGGAGLPTSVSSNGTTTVATNGLLTLVQNGGGNSIAPGAIPASLAATVIQNSLNNQAIASLTSINAAVNTLGAFRAMQAGALLNSTLIQSAVSR